MRLKVEVQAYLDQYSPNGQGSFDYELPDGANVTTLIRALNIPEEMTSVVIVNDTNAPLDHTLHEGDRVTLVPPLAGGMG